MLQHPWAPSISGMNEGGTDRAETGDCANGCGVKMGNKPCGQGGDRIGSFGLYCNPDASLPSCVGCEPVLDDPVSQPLEMMNGLTDHVVLSQGSTRVGLEKVQWHYEG